MLKASIFKTYKFYNYLIDKYLHLPKIEDTFISNEMFYYPKSIIKNYNSKKCLL